MLPQGEDGSPPNRVTVWRGNCQGAMHLPMETVGPLADLYQGCEAAAEAPLSGSVGALRATAMAGSAERLGRVPNRSLVL